MSPCPMVCRYVLSPGSKARARRIRARALSRRRIRVITPGALPVNRCTCSQHSSGVRPAATPIREQPQMPSLLPFLWSCTHLDAIQKAIAGRSVRGGGPHLWYGSGAGRHECPAPMVTVCRRNADPSYG